MNRWLFGSIVGCGCFVAAALTPQARGQDYLDQLQRELGISDDPAPTESPLGEQLGEPLGDAETLPPPVPRPPASEPTIESRPPAARSSPAASPFDVPAVSPVDPLVLDPATPGRGSAQASPPSRPGDRPYLGLTVEPNSGGGLGLRVVEVRRDSPAWKAGLTADDIVLAVDDQAVSDLDGFAEEIYRRSPYEVTRFLIDRDGRNLNLTVVLGSGNLAAGNVAGASRSPGRDDATAAMNLADSVDVSPAPQQRPRVSLGVTVEQMSDAVQQRLGIPVNRGALVTAVVPGSAAEAAGLQVGDCVIEVEGQVVQSDTDLFDWVMTAQPGSAAQLSVYRGADLQTATVRFPAPQSSRTVIESRGPDDAGPLEPLSLGEPTLNAEDLRRQQRIDQMQLQIEQLRQQIQEMQRQP